MNKENLSELLGVVSDSHENNILGISMDGDEVCLELNGDAFEAFLNFMQDAESSNQSLMFNIKDGVATPVDISILTDMTSE